MKSNQLAAAVCAVLLLSACSNSNLPQTPASTSSVTVTQAPAVTTAGTVTTEAVTTEADSPYLSAEEMCAQIRDAVADFRFTFTVKGEIDAGLIDPAFQLLYQNYPEYFWVRNYNYSQTAPDTLQISLAKFENYSAEKIAALSGELTAAANAVAAQIPAGADDYQKALFVHDYIVTHTAYDSASAEAQNYHYAVCHTAYGSLVKGSAVCEGYSRAFQYIMKLLGIECGTVSGMAGQERHAWNYIKLDGDYYWLDATWDDPSNPDRPDANALSHAYFLLNDSYMSRSHTLDPDNLFVPECSSMKLNYFAVNGRLFDSYDFEVFDSKLNAAETEFMFTTDEAYSQAIKALFDDGEIWNAAFLEGKSPSISYIKQDYISVFSLNIT